MIISGPYTASLRSTYIPMMAGYTLNLPIGDYTMFYLGGKAGATYGAVSYTHLKARSGNLSMQDLQGGCFTISNGVTYGSLLSTPILNLSLIHS